MPMMTIATYRILPTARWRARLASRKIMRGRFWTSLFLVIAAGLASAADSGTNGPNVAPPASSVMVCSRGHTLPVDHLCNIALAHLKAKGEVSGGTQVRAIVRITPEDKATMCEIFYVQGFNQPYWRVKIGYDGKVVSYEPPDNGTKWPIGHPSASVVIVFSQGNPWTFEQLWKIGLAYLKAQRLVSDKTHVKSTVYVTPEDKATMCEILYYQGFEQSCWRVKIGYDGKAISYEQRIKREAPLGPVEPSPARRQD